MAQIITDNSYKPEFTFESDAAASFLVIKCNAKVLEYQVSMLEHNRIRHVIPMDVVRKEGVTCLYYNITSKISLSFFLNRRKFSREEFLKLLLNIAAAVNDSAGYLLTDSNFIFNPEYIYISPETLEPALIYVPVLQEEVIGTALQGFIADMVLQHINIDGFGSGNFVQRILAAVKSEMFHIKGLLTLLTELLYGQVPGECDTDAAECGTVERQDDMLLAVDKNEKEQAKKNRKRKTNNRGSTPWVPVLAVLVQIVMGGAIYLCRSYLNKVSDNPTATYAAVALIVLAVEVLIFKRLSDAKLINMETGLENQIIEEQKEAEGSKDMAKRKLAIGLNSVSIRTAATDAANTVEQVDTDSASAVVKAASELTTVPANPGNRVSCKTELLGSYTKGMRLLRCTGKQSGDEDILINKDDFIIGRLEGYVDHILRNNAVGKLHAQLIYKNNTCFIKDLNSVNGTFINSKRIESNKEFELSENDSIQLANSEFVFISG